MRRTGELRRSGFPRKGPKPRSLPGIDTVDPAIWRQGKSSTCDVVSVPKREYVRSKRLLKAYRSIPCQNCGRDDGTVCCAHANTSIFGKGAGIKADDSRGASLCSACHVPLLDQGAALSRAQRRAIWWAAHVKTVRLLVDTGAWPEAIPVPDTSNFPWGEKDDD